MKWKTVGKIAKWTAIALVPAGAAGYVAYRYVLRPWLDGRAAAKNRSTDPLPPDPAPSRELDNPGDNPKAAG